MNIQVAGDFDGDMWGALGNVCRQGSSPRKAMKRAQVTPAAGKTLSVVYTPAVTMEVDGYAEAILDATGAYMAVLFLAKKSPCPLLRHTTAVKSRAFSVNGKAQDDYEKDLYTYAVTMGDEDQMLDFDFTIVNSSR